MTIAILAILYASFASNGQPTTKTAAQENGKQVIRVLARGGYNPKVIEAEAGKPSTLEIETKGTYDCSSALVIPSLQYQTQLPANGLTTIEIPPQKPGNTIKGLCAMGMYSFMIRFK